MLYGLRYGYAKSVDWVMSFLMTFTQSAGIVQPMKVAIFAAILAARFRKPLSPLQDAEDFERNVPLGKLMEEMRSMHRDATGNI